MPHYVNITSINNIKIVKIVIFRNIINNSIRYKFMYVHGFMCSKYVVNNQLFLVTSLRNGLPFLQQKLVNTYLIF
jgi:hypothetical protein